MESVDGLNTLIDFRYQQHFKAKTGGHGMGKNRYGAAGNDITLHVPWALRSSTTSTISYSQILPA